MIPFKRNVIIGMLALPIGFTARSMVDGIVSNMRREGFEEGYRAGQKDMTDAMRGGFKVAKVGRSNGG